MDGGLILSLFAPNRIFNWSENKKAMDCGVRNAEFGQLERGRREGFGSEACSLSLAPCPYLSLRLGERNGSEEVSRKGAKAQRLGEGIFDCGMRIAEG